MSRDWLDARFARRKRKHQSTTGLNPTDEYVWICPQCKTKYHYDPGRCTFLKIMTTGPCNAEVQRFNVLEIEAMPLTSDRN